MKNNELIEQGKEVAKRKREAFHSEESMNKQNILEALQCHGNPYNVCEDCPYQEYDGCSAKLARDASALIEEIERGKSD